MSDYIKREDAIETVYKLREHFKCWDRDDDIAIKNTLNAIPPADVRENVGGEWVIVVDKTEMCDKEGVKTWGSLCQCNKCGFVLNAIEGHTGQYNYCPNCGAEMRGDKNE